MKNNNKNVSFSLVGFLLFFLTILTTSTLSIMVFHTVNQKTNGNTNIIIWAVLGIILFGSAICCLCDVIRRKFMVEKPVNLILEATKKIAAGNFNVKLYPLHEYVKYDNYDLIFENINTMTEELSKNKILNNDFISNVSHEIKTPLTVIQNYAKTLKNEKLDKDKKDECLNGLIFQTKKLSDLITNILKLNKLENQKTVTEKKKFDLAELVRINTLQYENLFEEKSLQVNCDIDEISITSDASLIEIVVNNLISNAIKFTDNSGKIEISLKEELNKIILKVKDSGCGISSEVGKRIFDKFYQADTTRSTQGNGLGLALVKKVIDTIGGEIAVESKIGKGSTFIIKLNKD